MMPVLEIEKSNLTTEIQELAAKYGAGRQALLPILQDIQMRHRYVSSHAQQEVARILDIHPVEVYGVTTFYSFLTTEPQGRYNVRLCRTISCDLSGKETIVRALERELGIRFGETTRDKKFTLGFINCMGMCDRGPALLINDDVHTRLTPESVVDILQQYK